jgi:CO/xanthine dehydrogenase FAD-binding subunit
VVLIGVADTPLRIREAEQVLGDHEPEAASFQEAAEAVQRLIDPAGDIHGSADYRRAIAGVLTRRALAKATARAKGERVG